MSEKNEAGRGAVAGQVERPVRRHAPARNSAEPEAIYAAIGSRVRYLREALGMSQAELAKAVGLTRTSLTNFEGGRQRAMLHTIEQMAAALHTSPRHLLKGLWT